MTIHVLMKFIGRRFPNAIRYRDMNFLKKLKHLKTYKNNANFGKNNKIIIPKLTVDASQSLFQYLIAIRGKGHDSVSSTGKITSHITAILKRSKYILNNGAIPIYVYDGTAPYIKRKTLLRRKKRQIKAIQHYNSISDTQSAESIKYFKRMTRIKSFQKKESQDLLRALGLPFVQAPEEAESQCAAISAHCPDVYGSITNDPDSLVFKDPKILKNFSGKNKKITEIDLKRLLGELTTEAQKICIENDIEPISEFTYLNFVDLCILFGCDYLDGIRELGPDCIFESFVMANCDVSKFIKIIKKFNLQFKNKGCYELNFDTLELLEATDLSEMSEEDPVSKTSNFDEFEQNYIDDVNEIGKVYKIDKKDEDFDKSGLDLVFDTNETDETEENNDEENDDEENDDEEKEDVSDIQNNKLDEKIYKQVTKNWRKKYIEIPNQYLKEWKQAQEYYTETRVHDPALIDTDFKRPNREELIKILHVNNEFDLKFVHNIINEFEKFYFSMIENPQHQQSPKSKTNLKNSTHRIVRYRYKNTDDQCRQSAIAN